MADMANRTFRGRGPCTQVAGSLGPVDQVVFVLHPSRTGPMKALKLRPSFGFLTRWPTQSRKFSALRIDRPLDGPIIARLRAPLLLRPMALQTGAVQDANQELALYVGARPNKDK
jgi:hypothetical protein